MPFTCTSCGFEEEDTLYDPEHEGNGNEPWQCGLSNPSKRVLALYKNGDFTDITLTFPDTDITYDAHRLILAISSPVFEGILYGPMRTESRDVLIHDDNPLIMKYVIAHCYGEDLQPSDMDTALEVYKLADKYILNSLKQNCLEHIVNQMNPENDTDVIEFAERFNFNDLKSNCLPFMIDRFEETMDYYHHYKADESDIDTTSAFEMLMGLDDTWIELLLPEITVNVLDFQESWKCPEGLLDDNRLRTIISSKGCYLDTFYGCINAEIMSQFPLDNNAPKNAYNKNTFNALELFLSVTDPHHAKRVIDAINQQNRFESNFIALHIRCEDIWPNNLSPIRPERTHRPSLLLLSDADEDKSSWIVEAAKAFLPQSEGSYNMVFKRFYNHNFKSYEKKQWKPVNILFLPRSNFTRKGLVNMLKELSISGVKCSMVICQSPNISTASENRINRTLQRLELMSFIPRLIITHADDNMFRDVFEYILNF